MQSTNSYLKDMRLMVAVIGLQTSPLHDWWLGLAWLLIFVCTLLTSVKSERTK